MAEIKLKDFVDEESLKKLHELDETIASVADQYDKAAKELVKGLKMNVEVKGDADKLVAILSEQSKNAAAASGTLTGALKKQMEVAEQLAKKIEKKVQNERMSAKQARELAKASTEVAKTMQQTAKAEEALHKAQKAGSTTRKQTNISEKERQKIIKEALKLADREVHSIAEANEANKQMRAAVKLVKDTDEDFVKVLGKLNATIGVNTDYVKRNSDRYTQQKMTVGDYKEQIKQAAMEMRRGNASMKNMGIIASSAGKMMRQNLVGGLHAVNEGVAGMVKGFVGAQGVLMAIQRFFGAIRNGVSTIIDFEAANSKLAAVLGTTSDNINELTTDAKRLGATTKYTASQVTELQIELAKLGFTRTEILQSTEAVLKFAQATGAELGEAAALAGASLRMFGATTKESERYVSAMAVATARSALSFQYLATALPIVGPVAKAFNFTIEDTLALVGKLADAGFDASMAATATRNIFLNLADSGGKLAKALGKPVTNIDDLVEGLVSLRDKGVDLNTTLELTDKRSVAAFNAFLTAADKVKVLREQVTGVDKELTDMADTMANNVKGAIAGASSAWESLVLAFYNSKGVMKDIIDQFAVATRNYAYMLKSWEELQSEADNASTTKASKELADSDAVEKHLANMKKLYAEYVAAGMSAEEAQEKAKSEYIESLRSRLDIENQEYNNAIGKREALEKEYNERSFWTTITSWKRTNNVIKKEIEQSMQAAAGKKGLASITESIIGDLDAADLTGKKDEIKKGVSILTDEQKNAILKAEADLQQSKANLMKEGYEKEAASIRAGFEKKINAIKGENAAELELKKSLQAEMEKKLQDAYDDYVTERSKRNLENQLSSVEEGSDEELALRLQMLDIQKREELKAVEAAGADKLLVEAKYVKLRSDILGEYASADVTKIAENAAVEQTERTAVYNAEIRDLEKLYAQKLMTQSEYEQKKGELTERYSVDTARAAVEALEKQIAVEDLTTESREELMKKLTDAKAELAEAEADAEIDAIKRVAKAEETSYKERIKKAQQWLQVAGDAFSTITDFAATMVEGDIRGIEEEQKANDDAYDKDVERIQRLEENGVITKEEAEARKRAAEERSSKKNKELEERKQKLQQKQAKWDKANSIVQAGIATALAVTRALPNLVLAAIVGAMGAVQVATIAASPIPAYAKGTKDKKHPGGLALVGDGGKQEVVLYGSEAWVTPDRPTVVSLPKGAEVLPDFSRYDGHNAVALSSVAQSASSPVVINDYKALERKAEETNSLLRRGFCQLRKRDYRFAYENLKKNRL